MILPLLKLDYGTNGVHLKFKVKQGNDSFDVVAFNKGGWFHEFQ